MNIIKNKNIFIGLSFFLIAVAIISLFRFGLNLGIEFKGGAVVEVSYEKGRPELNKLRDIFENKGYQDAVFQNLGEKNIILKSKVLTEQDRADVIASMTIDSENTPVLERFNVVGPVFGKSLLKKSLLSLILVALAIIFYIAYSFRKMTEPVSSWVYGIVAIIALIHDMIIPFGIYAFLGYEINTLFVVGLLSILGLSINDTIIVFDRIKENLLLVGNEKDKKLKFPEVVGISLKQTMTRSINTSITLIVVLAVLMFVGPSSTYDLVFVLLLGTIFGTYSSIFFASPLLVFISQRIQGGHK